MSHAFTAEPLDWSDDAAEAPEPVVGDGLLLNRREVSIWSGDTGSCKSWLTTMGLSVAIATGQPWLGRSVTQGRVLVFDEENPARIARSRCRALGLGVEHRDNLRYFSRVGVAIGSDDTAEWIGEQIDTFAPSLIVVDGIMAATVIGEINSNDDATALYRVIRPWAEHGVGCHVLLLHHERKDEAAAGRARSKLTMGARQLVGQADVHLTTKWAGRTETELDDGTRRLRTDIELDFGKARDDVPPPKEYAYVESVKDGWRLVNATIGSAERPPTVIADADTIRSAAKDHESGLRPGDASKLLSCDTGDRRYKAAIEYGVSEGLFTQQPRQPIFYAGTVDREVPI
jgi:hypothetical protein